MRAIADRGEIICCQYRVKQRQIRCLPLNSIKPRPQIFIMRNQPICIESSIATGIATMTGPRIIRRVDYHPGTHRVHLDITHQRKQILLTIDYRSPIPSLSKRTAALIGVIKYYT